MLPEARAGGLLTDLIYPCKEAKIEASAPEGAALCILLWKTQYWYSWVELL